jgi:hypothetical protein
MVQFYFNHNISSGNIPTTTLANVIGDPWAMIKGYIQTSPGTDTSAVATVTISTNTGDTVYSAPLSPASVIPFVIPYPGSTIVTYHTAVSGTNGSYAVVFLLD